MGGNVESVTGRQTGVVRVLVLPLVEIKPNFPVLPELVFNLLRFSNEFDEEPVANL